jgi:hypothetical protein
MADRNKKDYEIELQWFRENGERVRVGPITTRQETVLIDPAFPEEIL